MSKTNKYTRVSVVLGTGGVGKTTVSAVLGLEEARAGNRVLVITLDPAKRLFDALGLKARVNNPIKVCLNKFIKVHSKAGSLHAFMPKLETEWRDFLECSTNKIDIINKIADNTFYKYLIQGLPGALEIICSHILFRFMRSNKYDVIILDTPPASNSISFLDLPKKISLLLRQDIFRAMFSQKSSLLLKITKKFAFFSGNIIENTLERLIGSHFLSELIDFALSLDAVYEPMLERTSAMQALLSEQSTKFILVCRPDLASFADCQALSKSFMQRDIFLSEIVFNQVLSPLDEKVKNRELKKLAKKKNIFDLADSLAKIYTLKTMSECEQKSKIKKLFSSQKFKYLFVKQDISKENMLSELLADYSLGDE